MSKTNDECRELILRQLYKFHQEAKSPRSAAKGIRDIQSALREDGLKQQEVARNLDYLLQKGWVVEIVLNRTFTTNKTVRNAEQVKYKISDVAIDRMEQASMFQHTPKHGGSINITNVRGVTIVGDGNVVNSAYTDAVGVIEELRTLIHKSELDESTKLAAVADLDTISTQLQKPQPNRNVIKAVWAGMKEIAFAAKAVETFHRLSHLLAGLLT